MGGWAPVSVQKGKAVMYRTEKARGIGAGFVLPNYSGNGYRVAVALAVMPHVDNGEIAEIVDRLGKQGREIFARPCPIKARHGFVESRQVKTMEDIQQVWKETMEQDNLGEVILMEKLSGKFSAVMTSAGVAWGRSNDGVTSGKGEQLIVPAACSKFDDMFLPHLNKKKGDKHGVYIELVEENGVMCVVQMRLGPKQPDSRVKRVVVKPNIRIKRILKQDSDDLIAWDCLLSDFRNQAPMSLVWLPGQTLASHFAVQALAKGYNLSVEEVCPVKVGQDLQPDKVELAPLGDQDFARLAEYLKADRSMLVWDYPRECLLSVAVLHALPYWGAEDHLLKLRSRGVIASARFSLAACLGESRHLPMTDRETSRKPVVPWAELMGSSIRDRAMRSIVFTKAFDLPWDKGAAYAAAAAEDHVINGQPRVMEMLAKGGKLGDWAAGYRGQKWEYASLKCHDLFVAVDKFIAAPNKDNWGVILGLYNELINAAHNGGYLLNKWVAQSLVDNVANCPTLAFGYPQVMNVLWGAQESNKGQQGKAWMPTTSVPSFKAGEYTIYGDGVYVHKDVVETLKADDVLNSEGYPKDQSFKCKCKACMRLLWEKVGAAAILAGKPCYVPPSQMAQMPYIAATQTAPKDIDDEIPY